MTFFSLFRLKTLPPHRPVAPFKILGTMMALFCHIGIGHSSEQTTDYTQWKKLLHFGEDKSHVISSRFFLSPVGNSDFKAELLKTVQLLKSANGRKIACNFPARYQWLRNNYNKLPNFSLNTCSELNQFKQQLQSQTVNLVFASEHLNRPVSSFGHVLLLLHDKDKPLATADTIHFAAETDPQDGFLSYTWKGLSGGYRGYFFRDPFFKKQFKYNVEEQRYLHLYQLKLTEQQKDKLVYHLFELRKAEFNYYFINQNCAYQIAALLDIIDDEISFKDSSFVLPIEVIKQHQHRFTHHRVLYPSGREIDYLLKSMDQIERALFDNVVDDISQPDNSLPDVVKYALTRYYEQNFRQNRIAGPNYEKVMSLQYNKPELIMLASNPVEKHNISRLGVGVKHTQLSDSALLNYRPFLQGISDTQPAHENLFGLSLFNTSFEVKDNTGYLQQFDLLDIKSLSIGGYHTHPVSWQFYTGWNRNNYAERLAYETELGLGLSHKFSFITLHYAVNLGADISNGEEYYKPNIIVVASPGKGFKIGIEAYEKRYQDEYYRQQAGFMSFSLGNQALELNYRDIAIESSSSHQLTASYQFYF